MVFLQVLSVLAIAVPEIVATTRLRADDGNLIGEVECGSTLLVQSSCGQTLNVSQISDGVATLEHSFSQLHDEVHSIRNEIIGNATTTYHSAVDEANRTAAVQLASANERINRLNSLLGDSLELLTNFSRCSALGLIAAPGGHCQYGRVVQCQPFNKSDISRNFTENNGDTRVVGTQINSVCNAAHFRVAGATQQSTCTVSAEWNPASFPPCTAKRLCNAGFFSSNAGSSTRDRVCSACPPTTYQSRERSTVTECTPWSACGVGRYASVRTATANVTCSSCTAGLFQLNPLNTDNITSCRSPVYNRVIGRSCTASSRYNPDYDCRYALDNIFADGARRAWATRGQGAGSWFRMNFDSSYIGRIRFRQRGCSCEWYRRIQITFSPGDQRRTINLARTRDQTITFPFVGPVTSAYLFFDQQYTRANNGADEIQFQGFPTPRFPGSPGP